MARIDNKFFPADASAGSARDGLDFSIDGWTDPDKVREEMRGNRVVFKLGNGFEPPPWDLSRLRKQVQSPAPPTSELREPGPLPGRGTKPESQFRRETHAANARLRENPSQLTAEVAEADAKVAPRNVQINQIAKDRKRRKPGRFGRLRAEPPGAGLDRDPVHRSGEQVRGQAGAQTKPGKGRQSSTELPKPD